MENNINLRNQYIKKVQDRVDKLLYSINLLDNLNEVISQKGGAGAADVAGAAGAAGVGPNTTLSADNFNLEPITEYITNKIELGDHFIDSDQKIKILEEGINKLSTMYKSATTMANSTDDEVRKNNIKLEADIQKLTTDLNNEKEKSTQCGNKLESLNTILVDYQDKLNAMKNNLPYTDDINNYNKQIDNEIRDITNNNSIDKIKDSEDNDLAVRYNTSTNNIFNILNKNDNISTFIGILTSLKYDNNNGVTRLNDFNAKKNQFKNNQKNDIITFVNLIQNYKLYKLAQNFKEKEKIINILEGLNTKLSSQTPS
jgi:hypothetical protein